jgi:hypothetical protein
MGQSSSVGAGTITLADMAANSVDSDQYVDLSIDNAHVATGLDAVKLADGTVTNAELQYINSLSSNAQTQISAKSPTASPTFTGTPAAPTASATTNTTQLATTAFVRTEVTNLIDSAPSTLDTLNELAAALGDDANFSTTVTNSIATKLPLVGGTMTGAVTGMTGLTGGTGDFNWDSNTLVVDSSESRVGIGTATPGSKLEIAGGADAIARVLGTTTAARLDLQTDSYHKFIQILESDGRFRLYNQTTNREQLTVSSDGNIGIGTSAPVEKLHVHGQMIIDDQDTACTLNIPTSLLIGGQGGSTQDPTIGFAIRPGGSGANVIMGIDDSDSDKFKITHHGTDVGGADHFTMDSSGKVGIGTAAPDAKLHVQVDGSESSVKMVSYRNDVGQTAIRGYKARGSLASPLIVNDDDTILEIQGYGHDGTDWHRVGEIDFQVDGSPSDGTDMPGRLVFSTTPNASGDPSTVLTLDSSQNATFAGDVLSNSHNSSNLGSSGVRWANLYVADVQMSNEGSGGNEVDGTEGSWTIQEGEEDLFLLNRKNGKKFKFKLQEIE